MRERQASPNGKLIGIGIGSTLDSGTNNFGQSILLNPELQFSGNNEVATIKLDIFGEIVLTLGTVPQGQGHETVASQVDSATTGATDAGSELASAAKERAKTLVSELEGMARRNPLGTIAGALLVGVIIGMMSRGRG